MEIRNNSNGYFFFSSLYGAQDEILADKLCIPFDEYLEILKRHGSQVSDCNWFSEEYYFSSFRDAERCLEELLPYIILMELSGDE